MFALFKLKALLSGAKTFIIGAIMVLVAVIEGPLGWDIPGVEVTDNWFEMMVMGLGFIFTRAGIGKTDRGVRNILRDAKM